MSCFGEDVETVALRDRLHQTARYLCGVLGWLESQHLTVGIGVVAYHKPGPESLDMILREIEVATPGVNPGDIQDWWETHQEQDARQDDQRSAFVFGED